MDITKAKQAFDRHKRVLGDYVKRGYIKKYEDAFADLEKTAAALPADQADQFRAEVAALHEETRKQMALTYIDDAKKNVQRHLKYAEDSMAKGVAKNVASAKDCIIKTVDKSDGRSYMEYHESGAPFLAEIDAMYEKIDAWFAANDPANKPAPSPAPAAATPKPAAAPARSTSTSTSTSSSSSTSTTPSTPAPAPAAAPAAAVKPAPVAAAKPAPAAAKEPEYKRLDDGAFLPVFDTSPSTGLPKQVLSFLPAMVNSYGKQCNQTYAGLVAFIESAVEECKTPFDIERKKHELSGTVPHLLDKIEQFERVIPKALAVDEALAKMLETEIAAARAKVDNLTNSFETKAKAAAPLLEVKTQLAHADTLVGIMKANLKETGVIQLRGLPAEYYSSAGVHLGDLWDILGQILDKAEAGAKQVAKLTGKPYDLATEEPLYNQTLTDGVRAAAGIFTTSMISYLKLKCFGQAEEVLEKMKAALGKRPIPEAQSIITDATTKLVEAKEAHEFRLMEEAKGRQVPRRNWAGGDAEAEKLEQAALDYLARNFSADEGRRMTPLIARIVGGDWAVIKRNLLNEPIQWNVLMSVIFFEDPAKGFPEPRLRLLQVGPCAREDGSRSLPFVFYTVVPGSQDRFHLENLPEPFKTEIGAKFEAWEQAQEEKRLKAIADAAAARKQAAIDAEKKWRADHKSWVDEFMTPFTGGKLVASGGESDGETWEYAADGTLRCTNGNAANAEPFEWNGMFLRQVWNEQRANDYGQGKWDKRKFEWTFHGRQVAYSYFWVADENKWKGTSYLNGEEHELAWDGKTLTSDVKTLDKNQIRFDKLTVEGSVPPYVVLAVALMGCLKVSHFECGRKMWEEAKKEEEARKLAAMLEIRLCSPCISERNMKHELMRRGFF